MKVLHYLNQFFGGIGGEDFANEPARLVEGAVGPGRALDAALGDAGLVSATIICGDNYFVENEDEARVFVKNAIEEHKPDVIVTGPAFDSGRYGLACGLVSQIARESGVPSISAMEPDNPGVAVYRREMICLPTGSNVAEMSKILGEMAGFAIRLGGGEALGSAYDEGYIPRGIRIDVQHEQPGSARAVEMVLARIGGKPFQSEIVIRDYDHVEPPTALATLEGVKVAIVTSGGLVPKGNPDKLSAARADSYFHYSIEGMSELKVGDWESIHGGYGHHWVNERDPNYVVPLRSLRVLESRGEIGSIYGSYISTVGNQTSISNAKGFGEEIVKEFEEAGVGAVIMVPTWGSCNRCGATITKELERNGIPVAVISAIPIVPHTVGANRIVRGVRIEHVCSDPMLSEVGDHELNMRIVQTALRALKTEVDGPTIFDPSETRVTEVANVS